MPLENREIIFSGQTGFGGIVEGNIFYWSQKSPEYEILASNTLHEEQEIENLKNAFALAAEDTARILQNLELLHKREPNQDTAEAMKILESHIWLLQDTEFIREIEKRILLSHLPAAAAIKLVIEIYINELRKSSHQTWKEKEKDLIDLQNRLLYQLGEGSATNVPQEASIIWADFLTPQQIPELRQKNIKAIVVQNSSDTAHEMILIRALKIPTIYGIKAPENLSRQLAIVDASAGKIILSPAAETLGQYRNLHPNNLPQTVHKSLHGNLYTASGEKAAISVNIGLLEELDSLDSNQIAGIGLFRSEFLLLNPDNKTVADFQRQYHKLFEKLEKKPVTIRLYDLGGDKIFLPHGSDNYSLTELAAGIRSIRFLLKHPELLRIQLEAIMLAAVGHQARILIPMVSILEEVLAVKKMMQEIEARYNLPPVALGVMIETPASIELIPALNRLVDFYSVGTNDLLQFITATDRNQNDLRYIYDPLHPALFVALRRILSLSQGHPLAICGELAADVNMLALTMAMGYADFSINPAKLPDLDSQLPKLQLSKARDLLEELDLVYSLEERKKLFAQKIGLCFDR